MRPRRVLRDPPGESFVCAVFGWIAFSLLALITAGVIISLLGTLLSPFLFVIVGVLLLLYVVWSGGPALLSKILSVLGGLVVILQALVAAWNAVAPLLPAFASLWNLLMDIVIPIASSVFGWVCDKPLTDPTFNALTDCPGLVGGLGGFGGLLAGLTDLLSLLADLILALPTIVEPIACLVRTNPGGLWYTTNCAVTVCADLSLGSGCYDFATALQWLVAYPLHFAVNAIDFAVPFLYQVIWQIATISGVDKLVGTLDLYDMVNAFLAASSGPFLAVFKILMGLLINFALANLDDLYCRLFSPQLVVCIVGAICLELGLGSTICGSLPGGPCACPNCPTGWFFLFGTDLWASGAFTRAPCTAYPSCVCEKGIPSILYNLIPFAWTAWWV